MLYALRRGESVAGVNHPVGAAEMPLSVGESLTAERTPDRILLVYLIDLILPGHPLFQYLVAFCHRILSLSVSGLSHPMTCRPHAGQFGWLGRIATSQHSVNIVLFISEGISGTICASSPGFMYITLLSSSARLLELRPPPRRPP